jgi:hypothetical protein
MMTRFVFSCKRGTRQLRSQNEADGILRVLIDKSHFRRLAALSPLI